MSKQTYSICLCVKRKFRLKDEEAPADIKALFENYSENGIMNGGHFHKFVTEVQGDDKLTGEEAEALMNSFLNEHKHFNIFHRSNTSSFTVAHFFRYLLSEINSPLPHPSKVHHDMTGPLSHYFIYTGHNSYLTGNQISSDSSEVPIVAALKRGVRVIELDMWPNSSKDDINILHGGTLTNPVKLIKCLKAIKENAFVASEYPVIITLEDHLPPQLQAKVAEKVSQTFEDVLFCSQSESLVEFPSPDSLRTRVIISTKQPKVTKNLETSENQVRESSEEISWGKEISDLSARLSNDDRDTNDQEYENVKIDNSSRQNVVAPPEYKHLIAIRNEKMKGGIKEWLRVDTEYAHRVSLNEEKLEKAVSTHGTEIIRFNQKNLMRVYPKATRIDSSNFNPFIGWMHGAQMVAFNMQTHGRPLWLMQGMFRANGSCGYVKKPDLLLNNGQNNEVFDPKLQLPVKTTLKIKVYMGEGWNIDFHRTHFDLYSPPDFYVKIGIAGVPCDSTMRRTKAIEDNWTPVWNEEFEFKLTVPELALLRVEVHEFDMSDKDDFGGQTCLPVSELRTGVRAVPLHDEKGEKYKSVKLLMHFQFV
ncbi:Phosphoinositide phospholipase C 2 [Striga hermonthica]|uniref:Phosphoinositide phospholipase C n=1 Tax=Striga hermonthica TaxID=68872 RepID=A0A9N7REU5_STRHE|nr:Phosphoinositide phospholipase C 2 [Striga hermonthica]